MDIIGIDAVICTIHQQMYKQLIRRIIYISVFICFVLFIMWKTIPGPEVLERNYGHVTSIRTFTKYNQTWCWIDTDKWSNLGPFRYKDVKNTTGQRVVNRIENDFIVKYQCYVIGKEQFTSNGSTGVRLGIGSWNTKTFDE